MRACCRQTFRRRTGGTETGKSPERQNENEACDAAALERAATVNTKRTVSEARTGSMWDASFTIGSYSLLTGIVDLPVPNSHPSSTLIILLEPYLRLRKLAANHRGQGSLAFMAISGYRARLFPDSRRSFS